MSDLRWTFTAMGDPAYSDVSGKGPRFEDEADAFAYGARLVKVGNWRSFTIEKRWWPLATEHDPQCPLGGDMIEPGHSCEAYIYAVWAGIRDGEARRA